MSAGVTCLPVPRRIEKPCETGVSDTVIVSRRFPLYTHNPHLIVGSIVGRGFANAKADGGKSSV